MNLDFAIWWQVYPLGACGAPVRDRSVNDAAPRLERLNGWLDYVQELGFSGLLLGPIFQSTAHGYDTLDHFRIDERLGDEATFKSFLEACHARGLDVILDGVFNHVGIEHPFVAQGGPVRRDAEGRPAQWEGDGTLAELDHDDPRTRKLVIEVMRYWLDRGISGWRLDVAYAVPPAFWADVIDEVHRTHPDAKFLGEMIHGDYAGFGLESHLDTVTQYELWKAIWSSIHDANFFELAHALGRHQEFSQRLRMQTFVGNHDVERIAERVGDAGSVLAAAVLLTVPGLPSVYYGDEQAFRGGKGEGWAADDALRPALPESPEELAAAGWWMHEVYRSLIALRRRHAWLCDGELKVTHTENEALSYRVHNRFGTGSLDLQLALAPRPSVRIAVDGSEEFAWRG
ncbi:alpha-amylase family protein [Corynebacterium atypicum]|uniref:alpha-amylase family protein n=1 Tax=Corynebacterium atypicum TaxID=191610 RepID=UPI0005714CCE|nr:alpha-amylase family protein [Corynebacterium atypicum]